MTHLPHPGASRIQNFVATLRLAGHGPDNLDLTQVKALSPSSQCEHTWTIEEARTLHKLLASALWETFHG